MLGTREAGYKVGVLSQVQSEHQKPRQKPPKREFKVWDWRQGAERANGRSQKNWEISSSGQQAPWVIGLEEWMDEVLSPEPPGHPAPTRDAVLNTEKVRCEDLRYSVTIGDDLYHIIGSPPVSPPLSTPTSASTWLNLLGSQLTMKPGNGLQRPVIQSSAGGESRGVKVTGGNSRHLGYNFYVTQERENLPPRVLILPLDAPEPLWLGNLFHLLVRKRPCSRGWRVPQGQPFQDKVLVTSMPSIWSPDLSQAPPGRFSSTFLVLLLSWAEG